MTQFATLTYTYTSGAWYAFCYCFVPVCKIWITSKPLKLQDPGCSTMISMVRHEVSGHLGTISWEKFGFWYFIELVPPSGLCSGMASLSTNKRTVGNLLFSMQICCERALEKKGFGSKIPKELLISGCRSTLSSPHWLNIHGSANWIHDSGRTKISQGARAQSKSRFY